MLVEWLSEWSWNPNSRHEYLHRCFIGVDHLLFKHYVAQRVDQRLQLHARHAHPLSQC